MVDFFHGPVEVLLNAKLARNTFLIRFQTPALAQAIRPGQFVMLRVPKGTDPLLGRPFALFDTVLNEKKQPTGLDIVYLVTGKMTRLLAQARIGDSLEVWGPLGHGFPEPKGQEHVGLVAGGIGQTPFMAHIRELLGQRGYAGQQPRRRVQRVSLFYGVRSKDFFAGVEDFQSAGADVHLATDDGSQGFHGFVTDLLDQNKDMPGHLFGCGPETMLKALSALAQRRQIPCHLSLETPMACGLGICFSCVTRVRTAEGWDYKRVCVDGPIFEATELCW